MYRRFDQAFKRWTQQNSRIWPLFVVFFLGGIVLSAVLPGWLSHIGSFLSSLSLGMTIALVYNLWTQQSEQYGASRKRRRDQEKDG